MTQPLALAGEAPATQGVRIRHVAASVVGNALEFFDFVTYAYFAVQIGRTFFPVHSAFAQLMLSLTAFGIGFISRPVGAVVLGAYADRAGRRPAMLLSFALMGVGVLGLALTPSYAAIGLAAPIIVVAARLVQGFALGGEVGPTTSFLVEAAPAGQRGLYGAWQLASQHGSQAVAGLIGLGLSALMSPQALDSWGWRIPFMLGAVVLPFGWWARHGLPETHRPPAQARQGAGRYGVLLAHARTVACGLGLVTAGTISTYLLIYMPTYAKTVLHMSTGGALAVPLVSGGVSLVCALAGGALSDRIGRRPVVAAAWIGMLICAFPAFLSIADHRSLPVLLGAVAALAVFSSAALATSLVWIAEAFPPQVRSATLAGIYATAVAVFGGTAPLVLAALIRAQGPVAPAWFLSAAVLVGLLAALLLPRPPAPVAELDPAASPFS